jgi:hypothetical protein
LERPLGFQDFSAGELLHPNSLGRRSQTGKSKSHGGDTGARCNIPCDIPWMRRSCRLRCVQHIRRQIGSGGYLHSGGTGKRYPNLAIHTFLLLLLVLLVDEKYPVMADDRQTSAGTDTPRCSSTLLCYAFRHGSRKMDIKRSPEDNRHQVYPMRRPLL